MSSPTMIVYCEGPPDWTHERFVVACYRQYLIGTTPAWIPQPRFEHRGRRGHTRAVQRFIGPDGHPQANQDVPDADSRLKLRFHCPQCGFKWQRCTDAELDPLAAMFTVFGKLAAAGGDEISVRAR
jgi:hypothetical protein